MIDRKEAKEVGINWNGYTFKVSEDDTYLYLEDLLLTEEEKKNFFLKWPEIKIFLSSQGILQILEEPEYIDNKFILAKAKPPKEGYPQRIEFLPKFSKLLPHEKEIDPSKKEDLRESFQKIICAELKEAIAKFYPAIPPQPGINIWGDPIDPPPLKEEKTVELGENVFLDEKENLIKAKETGVVVIEKGKLIIYPEYTLKGDVDFTVGNINFVGKKLTIQGDVKFGFKIECKGILELKGCTENKVKLKVVGTLISEGVLRGEETVVMVKGDAKIRGAEFANIEVEGNLYVKDYLIFTKTYVYGNIVATEGKGIVYGGEVCAEGDISANVLGHMAGTKSIVKAGYKKDKIEALSKLQSSLLFYEELLKKVNSGIELAQKIKSEGRLTKAQEEAFKKLSTEKEKIVKELSELKEEFKALKEETIGLKFKKIKVFKKIYPNVILSIADTILTIDKETSGPIIFYLEEEIIKYKEGL
ncbi:MAG: FapA family protein [Caldimicrobium sp.]